jgi:hypothetical protein
MAEMRGDQLPRLGFPEERFLPEKDAGLDGTYLPKIVCRPLPGVSVAYWGHSLSSDAYLSLVAVVGKSHLSHESIKASEFYETKVVNDPLVLGCTIHDLAAKLAAVTLKGNTHDEAYPL